VVVDAAGFSTSDRQKLVALVQSKQGDEDNEVGAPAAAVYKSHSSGIIDTLEDLKEKAESELADARKAETSAKHNYGMMKQSLDDQMAADTKDLNEEKTTKAASEEAKATAEGDLSTTISDLKDSENALSTANTDCMTTAADHEATVAARTEELKVIATAKKILQGTTSGAWSKPIHSCRSPPPPKPLQLCVRGRTWQTQRSSIWSRSLLGSITLLHWPSSHHASLWWSSMEAVMAPILSQR
jgi:hypothetical protein